MGQTYYKNQDQAWEAAYPRKKELESQGYKVKMSLMLGGYRLNYDGEEEQFPTEDDWNPWALFDPRLR